MDSRAGADHIQSHGYLADGPKTALARGLKAAEFRVARANGGTEVLRKPVERQNGRLGEFDLLDFSEVRAPGTYVLRAGTVETQPFAIGARVWDATIAKTIDFFNGERCGFRVPGVHDVCHRDWMASRGDQRIVVSEGVSGAVGQVRLELHPEKTRLIEFGRFAARNRKQRGEGKPETFTFLGFTHYCGKRRSDGSFIVWRKTASKRMVAKLSLKSRLDPPEACSASASR